MKAKQVFLFSSVSINWTSLFQHLVYTLTPLFTWLFGWQMQCHFSTLCKNMSMSMLWQPLFRSQLVAFVISNGIVVKHILLHGMCNTIPSELYHHGTRYIVSNYTPNSNKKKISNSGKSREWQVSRNLDVWRSQPNVSTTIFNNFIKYTLKYRSKRSWRSPNIWKDPSFLRFKELYDILN